MTTAPAPLHRPRPASPRRATAAPLRVVRPIDALDLDAAMADALAPHTAQPDRDRLAPVVELDAHPRRSATWARHGRRRVVLAVLALAAVLAVAAAVGGSAAEAPASSPAGATVTVEPGQTLWDVASEVTPPGGDVRGTVAEIRRLNDLDGAPVPAWTTVVLPGD